MRNFLYKKNLVDLKYKERESFSLNRDEVQYQKYYEIKVNAKYGQSKFLISSNDFKALIKGSFVEGPGLFEGVFIKKLEDNYLYLSRPVLSYGIVTLKFKCLLSPGDKWLDWSKDTWRDKITETKTIFSFDNYRSQDSYFLRVKNFYESRCPYPFGTLFIRDDGPIEFFDDLYCGSAFVNTYNVEDAGCGENVKYSGPVECGSLNNQIDKSDDLFCQDIQYFYGNKECNEYSNNISPALDDLYCQEIQLFKGLRECEDYENNISTLEELGCDKSLKDDNNN